MVITRVRNASPDMILTAFDVIFHEKQTEIPPEVCRPFKKPAKTNVEKKDLQKALTKTMSERTGFEQEPDQTGF